MLSEDLKRFLQSDFKKLKIIWIAFQAAAAIYYFVARFMGMQWELEGKTEFAYTWVFFVVAVLLAVASILYQKWSLSAARIGIRTAQGLKSGATADVLLAKRQGYAELDEYDRGMVAVFGYVQTSYIVTWSMQEAIAVLGLVMTIVTRDESNMIIFSITAFALLFTSKPHALKYLERAVRMPLRA